MASNSHQEWGPGAGASERLGVILILFIFLVLLREFISAMHIWCGKGSLQAAWCMGGECWHEVMAKGNRARLCHTSWGGSCCGAGRPLYQLGNVWGRLGGNFITLCWAILLMCYQTSARDPELFGQHRLKPNPAAMAEQREGEGKVKSDNLPPKQTPGGLCSWWTSHWGLRRCWSCIVRWI